MAKKMIKVDNFSLKRELKKQKLVKKVAIVAIVMMIAVVLWSVLTILLKPDMVTIPNLERLVAPFSFKANEEVFELLAEKKKFSDEELDNFVIYAIDDTISATSQILYVRPLNEVSNTKPVESETEV